MQLVHHPCISILEENVERIKNRMIDRFFGRMTNAIDRYFTHREL